MDPDVKNIPSCLASSTQVPFENWLSFTLLPLSVWKEIVFHARQTCKQQTTHLLMQNFSETITPIDNSCMLLFNPAINPVVC